MSDLEQLLENIREKPAMYIGFPSIIRLKAYIGGYRFATQNEEPLLNDMGEWLKMTYTIELPVTWDDVVLLLSYNNDHRAFYMFFELLDEYKAHLKKCGVSLG